jgi:hypothetical protein
MLIAVCYQVVIPKVIHRNCGKATAFHKINHLANKLMNVDAKMHLTQHVLLFAGRLLDHFGAAFFYKCIRDAKALRVNFTLFFIVHIVIQKVA